jgi:alanine racemase
MTHASVLEINLEALQHNFNFFKAGLKSNTKFLAVVKAFAYGSESVIIAKHLEKIGVDYLGVAYVKEGVALRQAGIKLPILVLHPQTDSLKSLIVHNLEPNLYSFKILQNFKAVADTHSCTAYPIHIKFNTGLNRLGFLPNDLDKLFKKLNNNPALKVKSIFSHLAASEDLNETEFTLNQINAFEQITERVGRYLRHKPIRHLLNTSGLINYPDAQYDMVRVGIGLYGFGNDATVTKQLKPVGVLKSRISQLHDLKKGDSIGYNRASFAEKNMISATIPIGHADGISRQLGNGKGYVYINNKKAFIVGNVCMDMLMVDVSGISCTEGDTVYIYRDQQHLEDLATRQGSISYELLTAISQRVERTIV